MKIKTSELEGAALNWAVAKAAYPESFQDGCALRVREVIDGEGITIGCVYFGGRHGLFRKFSPSTDWSQAGPLIAEHKVLFDTDDWSIIWATAGNSNISKGGDSHLIAACRAIVAAKLGDDVDVLEDLA